jgi:hypothetical protein
MTQYGSNSGFPVGLAIGIKLPLFAGQPSQHTRFDRGEIGADRHMTRRRTNDAARDIARYCQRCTEFADSRHVAGHDGVIVPRAVFNELIGWCRRIAEATRVPAGHDDFLISGVGIDAKNVYGAH